MERIPGIMMNLIANEVCKKPLDLGQFPLSEEEQEQLYKLSKSHDLAHLVGDALMQNGLTVSPGVKEKFEKQQLLAVYRYERINYALHRLTEALREAKIAHIPLKGSVIRQYYPEPWMRTSCDIDLLVRESDLMPAVAVLQEKPGYRPGNRASHDISLMSPDGVHLELHYSLIEEGRIGTAEKLLESIWEYAEPCDGSSEFALCDEMYYYYHLAHMAKHVEGGGCGVRPFLDLWILNHREHDPSKRAALLRQGGLTQFADTANRLSDCWFGHGSMDALSAKLERFVLSAGAYGNAENHAAVKRVQKKSKFRYLLSRIWMPYDTLVYLYPGLIGRRYLQPFYECRRWCKLLRPSMMKKKLREAKMIGSMSSEKVSDTHQLLTELGLL